jgi:flagellar basal body-associated protein FliL
MKTHSKSNNFIAILIAVILFAIGFMLYFIHEQSQSREPDELGQAQVPSAVTISHDLTQSVII